MKKEEVLDIYDMTKTVEIRGVFYERLSNHPQGEKYRFTKSLASDDYDYVQDKKMIKKLDLIFKKVIDDESAEG